MGDNDYRDLGVLIGTLFDVRRSNIKFEKVTGMGSVKIGAFFLFLLMMGALFSALDLVAEGKDGSFGGGSGTKEDPYVIEDVFDLQAMKDDLSAHYALGGDIDASATRNWNSGAGFVPVGENPGTPQYGTPFTGSLDGRNHTVSDLYIHRLDEAYIGLFGYVGEGSELKDIRLVDVEITGSAFVGALAGRSHDIEVINCHVEGYLSADSNYIGGLIGYNGYSNISVSRTNITVSGSGNTGGLVGFSLQGSFVECGSSGDVSGNGYVGGLIGYCSLGHVSICYSSGDVEGVEWVGGLSGLSFGSISNCFSTGDVSGENMVGGLVGSNHAEVLNCYAVGKVKGEYGIGGVVGDNIGHVHSSFWDINTTGISKSSFGIGKSTVDMKTRSTFLDAGWDLVEMWCIAENVTYPFLRWQDIEEPRADAGPDTIADKGASVTFNGSGSSDDIVISNYTWRIMDGSGVILHGVRPIYRADIIGTFYVTLDVTDALGRWDTDVMTLVVMDLSPPVADAGPDSTIDEGSVLSFDGSGSFDNDIIVNWTWTFFDVTSRTLYGPASNYRFDNVGTYVVTLNVTDPAGHWATDTLNLTVNDTTRPTAVAGPDLVIDQYTIVYFNGSSSFDNVGIVNYTWSFEDDGPVTLEGHGPTYQFNAPGLFSIALNVTDAVGLWDVDNMNVTVLDIMPPQADAGDDQKVVEGTLVVFDGTGSTDGIGIVNYTWTFFHGPERISLYGASPSYSFQSFGTYSVTLNVTDPSGNWDVDVVTVTVMDITAPTANAGEDRAVPIDTAVVFDGSLSSDNNGIASYTWTVEYDWGNQTIKGEVVEFIFPNAGTYVVVLTVVDASANAAFDNFTITVIDTGIVKGIVLDENGDPVEGAGVEITASDAGRYDVTTGSDGTFFIEIPHGAFSWRISKEGYRTIIGKGTVSAMDETNLDLEETPMRREEGPVSILFVVLPILLLILLIVGVSILFFLGKRKADPIIEDQPPDIVSSIDRAESDG